MISVEGGLRHADGEDDVVDDGITRIGSFLLGDGEGVVSIVTAGFALLLSSGVGACDIATRRNFDSRV
jgi:hypothetical protein